jgi:hypothetical protein
MNQQELDFEEVVLAYLRSSKKIELAKLSVESEENDVTYTATFKVSKEFPGNLTKGIKNPFSDLLKEIENEH